MSIPLACDMSAIPSAERSDHQRAIRRLVASATEIQESSDGFNFRLSAEDYAAAAEFVARERLCCPFLRFVLEVAPANGPVRLRVEGPLGTAAFIRHELELP
jgi:hypothetical protein